MTEPKINQIGKAIILEFETQQEAESVYDTIEILRFINRVLTENEDTA